MLFIPPIITLSAIVFFITGVAVILLFILMLPDKKAEKFKGRLWSALGYILIIYSFANLILIPSFFYGPYAEKLIGFNRDNRILIPILSVMAFAFSINYGILFAQRGRRLRILSAEELLKKDKRPPVLYLRSFMHDGDGTDIPGTNSSLSIYRFIKPMMKIGIFKSRLGTLTEEEVLAGVLNKIGPCVAVGDPNEELPPLGIARMYFSDDIWREEVLKYMREARLVVMRAGIVTNKKAGFWDELRMAVNNNIKPEKLVIILGFELIDANFTLFSNNAEEIIDQQMPAFQGKGFEGITLKGIIRFDFNWSPEIVLFNELGNNISQSLDNVFSVYK